MQADLVILNATVRPLFAPTGTTAIAVRNGRIEALGTDAEIGALAGPQTQQINAQGRELLPGFIESHLHLFTGGASLSMLNLSDTFGVENVRDAFRSFMTDAPGDDLISGFAANYTIFGKDRRPDRHLLDLICADRPICMFSVDQHCAWANTCALELAGILHGVDPETGADVVMGEDGLATGELREFAAMAFVNQLSKLKGRDGLDSKGLGAVSESDRAHDRALIRNAGEYCAQHGITSAVNMDGNPYLAGLLRDLALAGDMPVRVSLPLKLDENDGVEGIERIKLLGAEVPGWLHFGRIKLFLDGVYDTWTAYTVTDYPDRTGYRSEPLIAPDVFNAICIEADRRGLQMATHAVGDGAVRTTIDGYQAAARANGARDARHRVEHIDTIAQEDLDRLKPLGIVASMQPVHPPGSAGLPLEPTTSIMGRARWATAFPWRMIRDRNVPLAFGTDWPVSPLSPLYAIHCALTRTPWDDDMPDQRITLDDCLAAYTTGGAYADFTDTHRGALKSGLAADLVLIDGDLEGLSQSASAASVAMTFCDGRITYKVEA
ncbi:amidohydrolase [Pseudosulfitobacter sp. DSM 107133]|uniref:amidohydrolase n=1 Tax=Pseudosulfitobacter sp. DSM 107133 TaxID=2883100 RepID=UPI000DF125DA|nr:amidohydrolase [Pseudosulfitobacter sp. DSM 107133]UOA29154.1 N-substituted formamide deformylase [Pseudosulfitobacter sp. DSM 107133]